MKPTDKSIYLARFLIYSVDENNHHKIAPRSRDHERSWKKDESGVVYPGANSKDETGVLRLAGMIEKVRHENKKLKLTTIAKCARKAFDATHNALILKEIPRKKREQYWSSCFYNIVKQNA